VSYNSRRALHAGRIPIRRGHLILDKKIAHA
jgi:hypothetical protein